MSRGPAVVLDTNVVLSALVFMRGSVARLREAWHGGRCRPLASQPTISELVRALSYPKLKLSGEDQQELLADYLPYCTTVRMPKKIPKVPACRDALDRPFLELAVVGKADYLVTGDKDLLDLARVLACPILTAERFLELLPK